MYAIYSDKRKSGIPLIGSLPWGTDFCQFYEEKKDLIEILVPYFRAGLESNELCLWITSGALGAEDARKALRKAVPHFKEYVQKGQMEIIPQRRWRAEGGKINEAIVSRLDRAVLRGFDGLRLACNAFSEKRGGKAFTFEGIDVVSRYNVLAVFLYPRDRFDAVGLMEAVKNHRFALVRNAERWELIESSEVRTIKDALKRSQEKLYSLFNNMSEGFAYHRIVLNFEGEPCDYIFYEVNEAFEKLTGLKARNIVGKRVTEVLPGIGNDPTDWIGKYGQVALTGKPVQFDSYSELFDKWYSASAYSPHKGYFSVTFSDITERKRMEQALHESEEKLRVTIRSIGDAVIATDKNGLITFMNPVAEGLTGWKLEEVLNKNLTEVFNITNRDTRQPSQNPVTRVILEGNIVGLANHTILIARDGTEIPIDDSAAPIRDDKGNLIGVVLVFRDITDRKKAEETLRHAKEEWERTFDAVPDLIAIVDDRHRVMRVNRAMAERLDRTPDECMGLPCYVAVHGTDAPPPFCPHVRTLADGREHATEAYEERLGGHFLVSTTPIFGEQGVMIGSVHVARDITERIKSEEALRKAHDELKKHAVRLEAANRELESFSYSVSHDLRSPLRAIAGFTGMILDEKGTTFDPEIRRKLDVVQENAQKMGRLIDDLLRLSRLGRTGLRPSKVDMSGLVQEVFQEIRMNEPEREITAVFHALPPAQADAAMIRQVLANLISNAVKFTRRKEDPRIEVGSFEKSGEQVYYVKDNGVGFDMKYCNKLFGVFQRLVTQSQFEGTGVGLAIVQRIVQRHGGRVWAEGRIGDGACFYFTLPPGEQA